MLIRITYTYISLIFILVSHYDNYKWHVDKNNIYVYIACLLYWWDSGQCVYLFVVVGEWTGWRQWSDCSERCHSGDQWRSRVCLPAGAECPGLALETRECSCTNKIEAKGKCWHECVNNEGTSETTEEKVKPLNRKWNRWTESETTEQKWNQWRENETTEQKVKPLNRNCKPWNENKTIEWIV